MEIEKKKQETTMLDDTLLDDSPISAGKEVDLKCHDYQLFEQFACIDVSNDGRHKIIEELKRRDPLLLNELFINNVSSFIENQTDFLRNVLYFLVENESIDFPKKIQIIELLHLQDDSKECPERKRENSEHVKKTFNYLINLLYEVSVYNIELQKKFNVSTTLLFDTIKQLFKKQHTLEAIKNDEQGIIIKIFITIENIYKSEFINEDFKYKLFDTIKKDQKILLDIKIKIANIIVCFYFKNYKYNLFTCQYLLHNNEIKRFQLEFLYNIANNSSDELCIADIADFFLSISEGNSAVFQKQRVLLEEFKTTALNLFDRIKWNAGTVNKNIYNNKQNIHSINVDKSVKPFFEKLIAIDFDSHIPSNTDDENIHETITEIIETCKNVIKKYDMSVSIEKIERTIQRFILDNNVYTEKFLSLLHLLFRCYFYIMITNDRNEELQKRFVEEMEEMADTCSTGHLVRLANIFSGFDTSMFMDVEEELKACIFHRLTNIINSKPESVKEKIYEDIQSEDFMKSLSHDLVVLFNELEKEYVDSKIMNIHNLQESFRKYVTQFQT